MSSLTLGATTIASGTLTNARRNEGQTVSSFPPSRDPTISHVNSFFFKRKENENTEIGAVQNTDVGLSQKQKAFLSFLPSLSLAESIH